MDLGGFLLVMSVSGVVISSYQWLRVVMGCFWGVFGWLWVVMGGYGWLGLVMSDGWLSVVKGGSVLVMSGFWLVMGGFWWLWVFFLSTRYQSKNIWHWGDPSDQQHCTLAHTITAPPLFEVYNVV